MATRPSFDNRDLARIAVFAALIAVFGQVAFNITGIGVPITLQTLAVMLAGTVLGANRGALSVIVLLLLVLIGLPLLAGGSGGPGVFVGPTVGYLIGWIPGAWVTGAIAHSGAGDGRGPRWWRVGLGALVGGVLVVLAFGIPGTAIVAGLSLGQAAVGALVFLPGDLIKVVLATLITVALWKAYPQAFPRALQAAPVADASTTSGERESAR